MAFGGYLLRVGNYEIDGTNYIQEKSYKATRNIQDLESYRDANGVLHRNALEHVPLKIEINTRENLTNEELGTFLGNIHSQFTIAAERKCVVTAFIPELNDYVTQEMYMPDPDITIKIIKDGVVKYESVRLAWIGY